MRGSYVGTWRLPALLLALLAVALLGTLTSAQTAEPVGAEPVANFYATPKALPINETITFISNSTDADGSIVNHTWTFEDDTKAYGPTTTRIFRYPGNYTVTLAVTDDDGNQAEIGQRVIITAGGTPEQPALRVLRMLPNWLYWVMPLLVSGILYYLSYAVLSRGQPAVYNLVFFLLFATSATKSMAEAFAWASIDTLPGMNRFLVLVASLAGHLLIPLFLWFVSVFPRPIVPWLIKGRRGAIALVLAAPFMANSIYGFATGTGGWVPASTATLAFNVFASLVAIASLGLLVYHAKETDSEEERRRIRLLTWSFFIIVFSTLVLTGLQIAHGLYGQWGNAVAAGAIMEFWRAFGLIIAPFFEVVAATLLMYGILRYQLMGIESILVKATRSTLTALLVPATFVITSNSLEELFQRTALRDMKFGFIVAGFVSTFLMVPIQKWTTFLVHRLFPGALTAGPEEESRRRMEIYETQLRYCLLDGALTPKETALMLRLRDSSQVTADEIRRVAAAFPTVDVATLLRPEEIAPPPPPPRPPPRVVSNEAALEAALAGANAAPVLPKSSVPLPLHTTLLPLPAHIVAETPFGVVVRVVDALGRPVPGLGPMVTIVKSAGPATGALSGNTARPARDGIAAFDDLYLTAPGDYTLSVAVSGVAQSPSAGIVAIPTPARLVFHEIPSTLQAGIPFAAIVRVMDSGGRLVTDARTFISLVKASGPLAGQLRGVTSGHSIDGELTIANLTIDRAGSYRLVADAKGYEAGTSRALLVRAAAPANLAFAPLPDEMHAGLPFVVKVRVLDEFGNLAALPGGKVRLVKVQGPETGAVGGTVEATVVGGVATFAEVTLSENGSWVLAAEARGLPDAGSPSLLVVPPPGKLTFASMPEEVASRAPFEILVHVLDPQGKLQADSEEAVTIARLSGPEQGALEGTLIQHAVNGVARFTDLTFDRAGRYTLTATAPGFPTTVGRSMRTVAGPPSAIAFASVPRSATPGVPFQVVVRLQDAAGNLVAGLGSRAKVAIAQAPGNAALGGTWDRPFVGGVAIFDDLTVPLSGEYIFLAETAGVEPQLSPPVRIEALAPAPEPRRDPA